MVEDRLSCFSTSKRGHCIFFRVPFSILHCQSVPKHNPNTGWSFLRDQLPGRGSTNISSILHFHCQPQPQRHSNSCVCSCGTSGLRCHAIPLAETYPFYTHLGSWFACSVTCCTREALHSPFHCQRPTSIRYILSAAQGRHLRWELRVDEAR